MRNLLKLIKNLSFLLCFGFGLSLAAVPAYAVERSPACPNGCNADGSCKVVNVVAQVEEETPDEEEIGWSTLIKKLRKQLPKIRHVMPPPDKVTKPGQFMMRSSSDMINVTPPKKNMPML